MGDLKLATAKNPEQRGRSHRLRKNSGARRRPGQTARYRRAQFAPDSSGPPARQHAGDQRTVRLIADRVAPRRLLPPGKSRHLSDLRDRQHRTPLAARQKRRRPWHQLHLDAEKNPGRLRLPSEPPPPLRLPRPCAAPENNRRAGRSIGQAPVSPALGLSERGRQFAQRARPLSALEEQRAARGHGKLCGRTGRVRQRVAGGGESGAATRGRRNFRSSKAQPRRGTPSALSEDRRGGLRPCRPFGEAE